MANYLRTSYDILSKIFRENTFTAEALYSALDGAENAETAHRIVMGTLERNVELDYILAQLVEKLPKPAIAIIIKQGIYCLKYMDSLPDYAVIDNSVELTKTLGKIPVAGFVNAVLKKAAAGGYTLPQDDGSLLSTSVKYSKPAWIVDKIIKEYGRDEGIKILSTEPSLTTHIRPNTRFIGKNELANLLKRCKTDYTSTDEGFSVKLNSDVKKLFKEGKITYQSLSSIYAVRALEVYDGTRVLDVCSAPGGKAVLIAEENPKSEVTACDIYPHRVELISAYARRMKIKNVFTAESDATKFNPEFAEQFDRVLVDAPCSALGIINKQPDIMLNRKPSDIAELSKLQSKILDNASQYVKKGGYLVFSTCTILKEENDDNVKKFLATHKDFEESPCNYTKQYLPDGETDGFFVARFKKL